MYVCKQKAFSNPFTFTGSAALPTSYSRPLFHYSTSPCLVACQTKISTQCVTDDASKQNLFYYCRDFWREKLLWRKHFLTATTLQYNGSSYSAGMKKCQGEVWWWWWFEAFPLYRASVVYDRLACFIQIEVNSTWCCHLQRDCRIIRITEMDQSLAFVSTHWKWRG